MRTQARGVKGAMPRPPSDAEQIALRVPKPWLAQADELARLMSRPGLPLTRTDAFRMAMARGFEVIFAELRPTETKPAHAKTKR